MKICKCIEKRILNFALAKTLLIIFKEKNYNQHKFSS